MATAFTGKEREIIADKLRQAARACAATVGMRKTTVEQLAGAADISKGAFYGFYPSKEHLFFEILEEHHTAFYNAAEDAFAKSEGLPAHERAASAILAACKVAAQVSSARFYADEIGVLLRRLPPDVLSAHYHSEQAHIASLIRRFQLPLSVPEDVAVTAVFSMFFLSLHQGEIGARFDEALELIVRGICRQALPGGL